MSPQDNPLSEGSTMRPSRFHVTVMLDYYAPYISGLTEAARLTAEGLAARGWNIAVVCAQHDPALPRYEVINGVHVFRAPVLAHISRGFVSPALPLLARRLAARSDIVHMHLPNPEAALVAALKGKARLVVTYHIDVFLPDGPVNRFGMRAVDEVCKSAVRKADIVITNSEDQARGSRIWPTIRRRKLLPISSPCVDRSGGEPRLRDGDGLHIGFMGRITVDKGIEYLIRAFRSMPDPEARLLIAGDYTTVAGGSNIEELRAEAGDDPRIRFTGLLRGEAVRDFYASIDVFALPSISESFGIVQVEAMMAGIPPVSTDLSGSRYPVASTGFGRLVPPRDPDALREALLEMAHMPAEDRVAGAETATKLFGGEAFLDAHEEAFRGLLPGGRL